MLKKLVSLLLAGAMVGAVSVTAFASRGSSRIVLSGYDEGEILTPGQDAIYSLEDSTGDSLVDIDKDILYDFVDKKNATTSGDITCSVKQLNYDKNNKPSRYSSDYKIYIEKVGNACQLNVQCNNFPTGQNENYVEEITFNVTLNKHLLDPSNKVSQTIPMTSKAIKMSFGHGNVAADDLEYMPTIKEHGVVTTDSQNKSNFGIDAEFIPGKNYYFDLFRLNSNRTFSKYDLNDYTISVKPTYNSGLIKVCEIVENEYEDLQLHIQADPSYKNYGEGQFVKFRISAYPKGHSRRKMETYYAMGFSFPEYDVNSDSFHLDEYKPLLVMPSWDSQIKFEAIIDTVGSVFFKNFPDNRTINMSHDLDENIAIKDANPNASITYLNFRAEPSFVVPANVYVSDRHGSYVYEIMEDGNLIPIDVIHRGGSLVWSTSTLGCYAISPQKLSRGYAKDNSAYAPNHKDEAIPGATSGVSTTTPEITKILIGGKNSEARLSLNDSVCTPTDLKNAFSSNASNAIHIDTYEGSNVRGRMYINKELASKLTSPFKTKIIINPHYADNANAIKLFSKWFENKIMAVTFEQKGNFDAKIPVAVKVNFDGFKGDDVYIYRYNAKTNSYKFLQVSKAVKDDLSYFYFNTNMGDTLVMTDGPLRDKAL